MGFLLSEIKKAGTFRVSSIHGSEATRILEMGITPGTSLQVVRKAPTGFPIEIKVRGYLLTLREAEAASIQLEGEDE
ncbi:MAG: ferrous iron transport protein A [Balneola sp.]|nr:MAG: ferrous iron transport protein A [Balneola sp.]